MESQYSQNRALLLHICKQISDACKLIISWNKEATDASAYTHSEAGVEKMAATSMLLESIGEGVKKIDKLDPQFLIKESPLTPWKDIKGLRDHIAHGYFNLDADIIFDVAKNEIPELKVEFDKILSKHNV